jgi:hypothetical protein
LIFRKIKSTFEEQDLAEYRELQILAKTILIAFYDLEGMLRKLSASKDRPVGRQSLLVAAIAEKSRSAVALASA